MLLAKGPQRAGGAELQLAQIARQLSQRGWPVTFAFKGAPGSDRGMHTPDIELLSFNGSGAGVPGLRFLTHTLPSNWRLINRANADVYLQRGTGWQNGLLSWLCRRRGRAFVLWLASITDPYCDDPRRSRLPIHERWLARYGLRRADAIVAQTREQQVVLRERHGRDSVVIRNMWALPAGPAQPPEEPREVFWAATMRERKRPHLFLDVAEALPDLRFTMAGGPASDNPELYEETRARAEQIHNVEVLGFVPFREIDQYFARAAAYLCTSTIEGFPNTFLQAWSHGRPVVSTLDPDGIIAEHNLGFHRTGLDGLISAVRLACETSEDYIERTREYVRAYHSPDVIVPQIEELLWSL
ncbi:MAG: glycosyltransferase family 4 protein [Armatimonadota bacterium]|nr:glycosyltransferase family 4 protein [Armatimonadota bacterium]